MTKIVGEPRHLFAIEESSNEKDWSIAGTPLKIEEAAVQRYGRYKEETELHTRLVRYDRATVIAINDPKDNLHRSR